MSKKWKILENWTTESGLRAVAILNSHGNINGYVEVDKGSKCYLMKYYEYDMQLDDYEKWTQDKIDTQRKINNIEVHGGLTFSAQGDGEYTPSNNWWFGFDTSHAWDRPDYDLALEHFPEHKEDIDKYFEIMGPFAPDTSERDLTFVMQQCERLATQLKDIT